MGAELAEAIVQDESPRLCDGDDLSPETDSTVSLQSIHRYVQSAYGLWLDLKQNIDRVCFSLSFCLSLLSLFF